MGFDSTLAVIDCSLAVAASTANLDVPRRAIFDDRTDWLTVISVANEHLVAPALWTTFLRSGLCRDLPEDVQHYLSLLYTHNAARNERIRKQCISIGEIFAKTGVRAALLKGVAWLFDDNIEAANDRMMRDIDFLVAPDKLGIAVSALIDSGYRDTTESLVEVGHFHYAPLLPKDGEASVEIHRDLAHSINLLPANEVLASAREVAPGLLLPSRHHRILHNVIHAQIENGDYAGGVVNLRDALDLARLLFSIEAEANWAQIADDARRRGVFRYLSGAIQTSHRVLNSPLPEPFSDRRGKLHAWRCLHQRRRPLVGKVAEKLGILSRALAWDRDAYALNVKDRSWKSRLLVSKRRAQRAQAALQRLLEKRDNG